MRLGELLDRGSRVAGADAAALTDGRSTLTWAEYRDRAGRLGGRLHDAGLRPGMVITEVDREPIASVEAFEAALSAVGEGESVLVRVRAGDGSFLTALTKE